MLRQFLGLLIVAAVGLVVAVGAFGKGPPSPPPGKPCGSKKDPCTTTVQTTVPGPDPSPSAPAPSAPEEPVLADLALTVQGPAGDAFSGADLTYTAVITNNGPASATNVRVGVVPAGSRLLSGVAGTLGTLAPGASTSASVTLVAGAPGAMSATFTVSADQPDAQPSNNVAVVSAPVLAGHAGPPGLQTGTQGAFAPPLFAVRAAGGWSVATKVYVDEPATVVVRVLDSTGFAVTMLPGTLIDYLPAMRPHLAIPHVLATAAWLPLRIVMGGPAGRSYRLVVQATGPDGSVASTAIGFRTP